MDVPEYRQTASWAETIDTVRSISRVIEALPNNEEYGLTTQLQHLIVELPVAVGKDLQRGTTERLDQLIRLYVILNIVETIYPSLDLAEAQTDLDKLQKRLSGLEFEELLPTTPPPTEEPTTEAAPHDASSEAESTPDSPPSPVPGSPADHSPESQPAPEPLNPFAPQPLAEEPQGSV